MKLFLTKVSRIGLLPTDSENLVSKKVALTLLQFYVFLPALIWSIIYLSLDNFIASLVPVSYILISIFSTFILYKTKNFVFFETTQLLLILLLPFILMWLLGGFYAGSFVLIWSFYAPVAAVMYSEKVKHGVKWFVLFLLLVFISMLFDDFFMTNIQSQLPPLALKLFVFLNVGAGFGGIFFLMSQFIHNIKDISKELKSERETLSILANDLRSANKELEQLATCDIVTELPNRLYFQDIVFDMFKRAHANEKIVAMGGRAEYMVDSLFIFTEDGRESAGIGVAQTQSAMVTEVGAQKNESVFCRAIKSADVYAAR